MLANMMKSRSVREVEEDDRQSVGGRSLAVVCCVMFSLRSTSRIIKHHINDHTVNRV